MKRPRRHCGLVLLVGLMGAGGCQHAYTGGFALSPARRSAGATTSVGRSQTTASLAASTGTTKTEHDPSGIQRPITITRVAPAPNYRQASGTTLSATTLQPVAVSPPSVPSPSPAVVASATESPNRWSTADGPDQWSSAASTPAAGPVRYVSALNLYGELPDRRAAATEQKSDNLNQVSFTREGADFDVSIDPSGQWLVYASTRHRPTADIYMKRVNGNTITQLTDDPGNDVMPTVSSDGQWIAFSSDRAGNWDVYVKPIAGGQSTQISSAPSNELHPSWSPDGRLLTYCAHNDQSGQWEVVVVDVTQASRRRVIANGLFPEFSPDGGKILFQRARARGTRWFSIWTVDYEDGEGVRPTEIAAATNAAVITPVWSPDGQRIAFATVVDPLNRNVEGARPTADLWVVNADGSGRQNLTNDRYANLQPTWGPDGTIYFVSNRAGWDNIWSLKPQQSLLEHRRSAPSNGPAQAAAPTDTPQ